MFVDFQCIPGSCEEQLPPTENGTATVVLGSDCDNGVSINASISSFVANCSVPFSPEADIQRLSTLTLDDFGCEVETDFARFNAAVFTVTGGVLWHASKDVSCDGGETGLTSLGDKPC